MQHGDYLPLIGKRAWYVSISDLAVPIPKAKTTREEKKEK